MPENRSINLNAPLTYSRIATGAPVLLSRFEFWRESLWVSLSAERLNGNTNNGECVSISFAEIAFKALHMASTQ